MAEVAGLVVGAVALAGLVGAFKDVVDVFGEFADSRELGRNYEVLEAKLDIERTILLQWADRVRLLQPNHDVRLDDHRIQQAIAQILCCIKLLMSDASRLKQSFGLSEAEEQHNDEEAERAPTVGSLRMERFTQEFEALQLRIKLRNHGNSIRRRVRWVIRDKQKFENLVKELAHFTSKLSQIMPIYSDGTLTQNVADEDVESIRDIRMLKIVHDASMGHNKAITDSAQRSITRNCQDRILAILWFRAMDDREASISLPHNKTMQWALQPPQNDVPWDDFSKWLTEGSGIYWISGKAGSGKSTLMKYLFHHPETRALVSRWAGGASYSLIPFFFWNLGTSNQKSQEGLARTLLFRILSIHRTLIAEALPNMWKELYDRDDASLPSVAETRYAFQTIATRASTLSKFCLFIDGLDEYVGDYRDGIAFIRQCVDNTCRHP